MTGASLPLLVLGGAPVRWLREMALLTAGPASLRRASGWLPSLASTTVDLGDDPLYGRYLDTLTNEVLSATEQAGAAESRRPRSPASSYDRDRAGRGRGAQAGATSISDSAGQEHGAEHRNSARGPRTVRGDGDESARALSRRADESVLRRYAGESAVWERANAGDRRKAGGRAGADVPPPVNGRTREAGARRAQVAKSPRAERALPLRAGKKANGRTPAQESHAAWRGSLIGRTARVLRTSAVQHAKGEDEVPMARVEASLERQWLRTLAGPAAPSKWLFWLSGGGAPDAFSQSEGAADRTSMLTGPHSISSASGASPLSRRGTAPFPEPPDSFVSHHNGSSAMPPSLARMLPPLTTPQAPSAPELTVAAMRLQQGAWAEAVAAQDDLTTLASNIKRILDEEARRHGIDV